MSGQALARRLPGLAALLLILPACGGGSGGSAAPVIPLVELQGNVAISRAAGDQRQARLVPDAAGGAFLFWTDTRSGDLNIYVQRLNGLGAPLWTAEGVAVTTTDSVVFTGIAAVADGSGGAMVFWTDARAVSVGAGSDVYGQRVGADGGFRWTANGVPVLTNLTNFWYPDAVSDGAGGAIVFARENDHPFDFSGLFGQRVSGDGLPQWGIGGVQIASNVGGRDLGLVAAAADGTGGALVTWTAWNLVDLDGIHAQRLGPSGALLWGASGVVVSQAADTQWFSAVVADGLGGALLAWTDDRSSERDVYAQKLDALGQPLWAANGVPAVDVPGEQRTRRIAADGAGGLFVVFEDWETTDGMPDLAVQRLNASGVPQWAAQGVGVAVLPDYQDMQDLADDGAGGLVVVWRDFRSRTSYDVYAQRLSGAGVAQWTSNGIALATAAYDQTEARIVRNGTTFLLAWEDHRPAPSTDLYGQSLGLDGAGVPALPSSPAVEPWHAFNVPVCMTFGNKGEVYGVSDGAGGAILFWFDQRPGAEGDYLQRIDAYGQPLWGPEGIRVSPSGIPGFFQDPLVSDGAGGAIVGWVQNTPSGTDILAQRVGPDGSLLWGAGGVDVCTAANDQQGPSLVTDGAGGAILVWEDGRPLSWGLYAQRLNAAGAAQWTSQGVPVSAASSAKGLARITSDGASGVVATWSDGRNSGVSGGDIFAQRLDAAGAPQWGTGTQVCSAAGDQIWSTPIADGVGGWLVAWSDPRVTPGVWETYAQRLDAAGVPQWASDGIQVATTGGAPHWVGAILVWNTQAAGYPLLAQKLSTAGATLWDPAGVAITGGGSTASFALLSDGANGLYVAWGDADVRSLRFQHVDSAGAPQLAAGGVPICTAANLRSVKALISDGATGVLVAWQDRRRADGYSGVYAQHLTSAGTP